MDASVGAEFDDAASDGFIELGGGEASLRNAVMVDLM
jgi:hypothetical protein